MKKHLYIALSLMTVISGFAQTTRLSLLEEFTGENCLPCAYTNPGLNALLTAQSSQIIAIKWQVPIPTAPTTTWSLYQTNSAEINARAGYYGINFAPQVRIDGQHLSAFNASLSDNAGNVDPTVINTAQAQTSPFAITMLREWNPGCSAVNLSITVTASANYTSSSTLIFRTVMVERLIQFSVQPGTNGEYSFEDVGIKSFPSLNGYTLNSSWSSGQSQTFTLSCPIPSYTRDKGQVAFVGFIQDEANQNVLQAVRADKEQVPVDAMMALDVGIEPTCSSIIKPQISIYNNGVNPITQFTVIPYIDQVAGIGASWNGNIAAGAATVISLNSIASPTINGPHTFSYQVIMPGPYNLTNVSSQVNYLVAKNYQASPVAENFNTALPTGWTFVNSNSGSSAWSRVNNVGSFASISAYGALKYNFYNNNVIGDVDEFYLPPMNLSGGGVPVLSFDLAKAPRAAESDRLDIFVSKDCGASWTNVYSKAGQTLATSPANPGVFYALQASDWRKETINLTAYAKNTVLVKFRVTNDNGNNMYIDNVNVSQPNPAGIVELSNSDDVVSFFPDPAGDESNLEIRSIQRGHATLKIMNSAGQLVCTKQLDLDGGTSTFKINTSELSGGIYFTTLELPEGTFNKKLVVSH